MNIIPRLIQEQIRSIWSQGKIIIVYGPRQTGKTTLLDALERSLEVPVMRVNGDRAEDQKTFSSQNLTLMKNAIGTHTCVMFDEAQRIPNIGINLKILHDNLKDLHIMATGSSSFDLANHIREPLTGRTRTFMLYPVAFAELQGQMSFLELQESLPLLLQYGMYPEVVSTDSETEKGRILDELSTATMFKDILELEDVKNPRVLRELITLVAFQIGCEVSLSELAGQVGISVHTVKRYLDLFEKAFLIFRLGGFSRNLRKEVTKNAKYYFFDVGLRNAIISNYSQLSMRNDVGVLWENFLIAERIKTQAYKQLRSNCYFWRTYDGQEIDWIEERDGTLHAFEFKWKETKVKLPPAFDRAYADKVFQVVNRTNYLDFIT